MLSKRKVLVVALMAVALLGSFVNAKAGLDKMTSAASPAPHATFAMDAKEILEVGIPKLL